MRSIHVDAGICASARCCCYAVDATRRHAYDALLTPLPPIAYASEYARELLLVYMLLLTPPLYFHIP